MRSILIFLAALFSIAGFGQTITTEVIVTNTPASGFNWTFAGSYRYWTNARTATTIDTNTVTDVNYAATNLYAQVALSHYTDATYGEFRVQRGATNSIKLLGPPGLIPSISQNSNWIRWVFTTNGSQPGTNISVPAIKAYPKAENRTNILGQLQSDIVDYGAAGKPFPTTDPRLTNFLNKTSASQSVTGITHFIYGIKGTNQGLTNGPIVGAQLSGGTISGTNVGITNGPIVSAWITGSTFDSGTIGATNDVELIRIAIIDADGGRIAFKGPSGTTNAQILAKDSGAVLYDGTLGSSTPLDARVPDDQGVILNYWTGIRIFPNLTSGTYIGTNVWNIRNDWFGTLNVFHDQLGAFNFWATGWKGTNGVINGTNQWHGSIQFPRAATGAIRTGLANTNNYLDAATNAVIYVTGATTLHNFTGIKGGQDGQVLRVRDGCGTDVEIFNLDGSVAAADRIWLGTGAAKATLTNRPVFFDVIYNIQSNWWELVTFR